MSFDVGVTASKGSTPARSADVIAMAIMLGDVWLAIDISAERGTVSKQADEAAGPVGTR